MTNPTTGLKVTTRGDLQILMPRSFNASSRFDSAAERYGYREGRVERFDELAEVQVRA